MSKAKSKIKTNKKTNPKKKVVVTTSKQEVVSEKPNKRKLAPTRSKRTTSASTIAKEPLLFGKQNYILMGIGLGLITLGLILMSGGGMPSPDVWDESIIYGFRRTVLAPFLILAGLIVEIFAIFKK